MSEKSNIAILIIDDEVDLLEILEKRLTKRGFQVFTAVTCGEGLQILREKAIDIVILDVMLPDLHGLKCLVEIKNISDVPVILLTGHASLKTGIESIKLGARDYCLKPIELEELIEKIKIALKNERTESK